MSLELGEPLLTARDVSELLAIPRSTVYELVRRGELPCVKVGRHLRWTRGLLELYLEQQLNDGGRTTP